MIQPAQLLSYLDIFSTYQAHIRPQHTTDDKMLIYLKKACTVLIPVIKEPKATKINA